MRVVVLDAGRPQNADFGGVNDPHGTHGDYPRIPDWDRRIGANPRQSVNAGFAA